METWKKGQIKDFAQVKGGKRLPKGKQLTSTPNQHPYIRIKDLGKSKVLELTDDYEYVDDETQKSISRYIVATGDILISVVGTVGLIGVVGKSLNNANQTENCDKLVDIHGINKDYLYYYLISSIGQEEIRKGTVGAVQPKLPLKNIQDMNIWYPCLETQEKISKILNSIDELIACNSATSSNLEEQMQTIFKGLFIDSDQANQWARGTFSDLIVSTLGGDWGKETPSGNNSEMVYCIRGADIPEVKAGNKGKMPVRYIIPKNYETKHLVAGDIVVEISGGSPTQSTGRAAAISQALLDRYDRGMVCTNFCRAIKPKPGYGLFIYHYWQYLYNQGVFFNYENGTTGIKNLDINGFISTEEIVIPPKERIYQFNQICLLLYEIIYSNGLKNEKLSELRDNLLEKIMSQELDLSRC